MNGVGVMFKKLNIIDEKDKRLRKVSEEVTFPLSKEDKKLIQKMIDHLTYSQIEEYEKKYDLRPGMGLAFPQLGINKRIIVVVHEVDDNVFDNYVFINPVIVSNSTEVIAAEAGEGCLSVNREVDGHVPRYARITIEGYDEDGNKIRVRAREDLAIAFQHEIDHLDGIMFYDRIDKKKPFFSETEIRLI
jgi:peptide deformylase